MTNNSKSNRSIRVDDRLWDTCRDKAAKEAPHLTSMTQVVVSLLEGYASGHYRLPIAKLVYADTSKTTA